MRIIEKICYYFISSIFYVHFSNLTFLEKNSNHDFVSNKSDSIIFLPLNHSSWSDNFVIINALVEKTVTFTCSIELDGIHFFKSENYKVKFKILF